MIRELFRVVRKLRSIWEDVIALRYRRLRFRLSCHAHNVELVLGPNVHFFHPVYAGGHGGRIVVEQDVSFSCRGLNPWRGPIYLETCAPGAELRIDRGCLIMSGVQISCFRSIHLGAQAWIGGDCFLLDSDVHDFTPGSEEQRGACKPIVIGQRAKLLPGITVLKGVSIGDHTVVGGKSVVQGNLPSRCLAAGNPARVLLRYGEPNTPMPAPGVVAA